MFVLFSACLNGYFYCCFVYRESFKETLEIDFRDYGPLIDPAIEVGLQST